MQLHFVFAKPPVTRLFGLNIEKPSFGRCLVYTNYAFDVGVMRTSTLKFMEENPLPTFEFSRRLNASLVTNASTRNRVTTPANLPRPSTLRVKNTTTTKNLPKLTTIYMTSTEKVVTSTEFRLGDNSVELPTESLEKVMASDEVEKAKILERDNDAVGQMTTINSGEEPEMMSMAPNLSSMGDLRNLTRSSDNLHLNIFSAVYCVYVLVLE
ncbi:hypothetical protein COOONC_09429 [Cooperia oncophora]